MRSRDSQDAADRPPPASGWSDAPLDWARDAGLAGEVRREIRRREEARRRRRQGAVAAAVVFGVIAGVWLMPRSGNHAEALEVAERRMAREAVVATVPTRTLEDGTVVQLRPGATIQVEFTVRERRVLLTHGEALFDVRKDASRPFVVVAGGVRLRAVGTSFSVGLSGDAVEMLVTEGTVAVERTFWPESAVSGGREPSLAPAAHGSQGVERAPWAMVSAGNRIVVAVDPRSPPTVVPVTPLETSQRLAWRVPRLDFNATPLAEVVELLNRHRSQPIEIESERLRRLEISGSLRADNPEPLLGILETNYGVEVRRGAGGEIRLR